MYERFSTNNGKKSIKHNQEILYCSHENNMEGKAVRAPNKDIITIVETTNPENKLEIDYLIDPHITSCMSEVVAIKELKSFFVTFKDTSKALKIGKELSEPKKGLPKNFLIVNLDVFAWKNAYMVGVDPKVACYASKIDPKIKPKMQSSQ